jgi:polysaccharide pyruvyl transferase WcaK-like protein/glycosyltransferase involved in cell wall biosynthesis
MRPSVLVLGDVCRTDEFHLGDEAMFQVAVEYLSGPGECDVTAIVENPAIAQSRYGMPGVKGFTFANTGVATQLPALEHALSDDVVDADLQAAMRGASLVLIAGGGNLAAGFSYLILERLAISRLARRYGVPVVLMSQSIGPFFAEDERTAVNEILANATLIGIRELTSWRELVDMGIPDATLRMTGDDALELCATHVDPVVKPHVLLSIDTHLWRAEPASCETLMHEALDYASSEGFDVKVLPQTWKLHADIEGSDEWVSQQIVENAKQIAPSVSVSVVEQADTRQIARIVSNSHVVISSRYHPVVFATAAGRPCVFVSSNSYTRRKGEGSLIISATPGEVVEAPISSGSLTAALGRVTSQAISVRHQARLRELASFRRKTYEEIRQLAHGTQPAQSPRIAICTIVASNYLAQAMGLEESVERWHPEASMVTLIADDPSLERNDGRMSVGKLRLPQGELSKMAAMYDVTEFATALKPWLLSQLLDQGFDQVWYIDPDIRLFAPLSPVRWSLDEHAVALTPHALTAYPRDAMGPSEAVIRHAGIYNLGFIGVTPRAREFLNWWGERLLTDAVVDLDSALFTDQRLVDFAPAFTDVAILDSPGLNVAYWNLHERIVESDPAGSYLINREPLYFFHFSGFDPRTPLKLTRHAGENPRVSVHQYPALPEIVANYVDDLNAHEFSSRVTTPYSWGTSAGGVPLDRMIRQAYRSAVLRSPHAIPPNPFSHEETAAFEEWVTITLGAHWRLVPTLLRDMWVQRQDFQATFVLPCGSGAVGFLKWAKGNPWIPKDVQQLCEEGLQLLDETAVALNPRGFNVVGYFHAGIGLGEASRRTASALLGTGFPLHFVGETAELANGRGSFKSPVHTNLRFTNSIVAVNADAVTPVIQRHGIRREPGRRNIGVWFWELEEFPRTYSPVFQYFDEIWAASTFMQQAIAAVSPIPVHKTIMEIPLVQKDHLPDRRSVGFDERFTFFYTYDANSIFQRKNPLGAIAAYRDAFPTEGETRLVIRTMNSNRHPEDFAQLVAAKGGRDDIEIIDAIRSLPIATAEIAQADCFVSLHRSEGFGLNIATAAAAGTPVISTNYSGPTDFLLPESAWLTDYQMTRVGDGSRPYPANALWAEPNHEHAVANLRDVFNASNRLERAAVGREYLRENFSYDRSVDRFIELVK